MKTSRFNRFAGLCLALILSSGLAFSSHNNDGIKKLNPEYQKSVINFISGLSEYQKERIFSMEAQHRQVMSELQGKMQSSSGKMQKAEIRKQMDKQIENHQNTVLTVLSADQQKQLIMHQINGENQKQQMQKQGKGKGSGHGNGSGQGRGQGQGMGGRVRY